MNKQYVRKDGTVVWVIWTVTPIRDAHKDFQYAIAMVQDISDKKSNEEMLRKWATVFQHVEWGVAVSKGGTPLFDMVNPAYARMHRVYPRGIDEKADLNGFY